jgi:hypothetical protein
MTRLGMTAAGLTSIAMVAGVWGVACTAAVAAAVLLVICWVLRDNDRTGRLLLLLGALRDPRDSPPSVDGLQRGGSRQTARRRR